MNKAREREIQEYEEKLNALVNTIENRTLTRPGTNMKHVWACLIILVIFYFVLGITTLLIKIDDLYKIIVFVGSSLIFNEFFIRFFGIKLIECYQHYAADEVRRNCRCLPSCSEYSILVLKKYMVIIRRIIHKI